MKRLVTVIVLLIMASPSFAQEKQWDKYIPEKPRKAILKKSFRGTGLGAALSGRASSVLWLTEQSARAVVSDKIDNERLTSEEAEQSYQSLRNADSYSFIIYGVQTVSMFGVGTAKGISNPITENQLFLQRSDNKDTFSKGLLSDKNFDIYYNSGGSGALSSSVAAFPKSSRDQKAIVNSLDDKIQIQFVFNMKKVLLEYKIKDLVSRLEDL